MGLQLFYIFLVSLLSAIAGSLIVRSILNGISPMPSVGKSKTVLLEAIPKSIQGKVYELGAGWGSLVFPLAAKLPSSMVIGIENSLFPYVICRLRRQLTGPANVELKYGDFFNTDLSEAALVVCYLYPGAMQKLRPKLEKELKKGAVVISNTFALPGWTPVEVHQTNDLYRSKIYVYKI